MEVFKQVFSEAAFSAGKLRKVNLFDTERMFCDVYCFESGQAQSPHAHAGSDKIYYVLQGCGEIQIGQQIKAVAAGDIALAPAGIEHGVRNPGPERFTILVFMSPKP